MQSDLLVTLTVIVCTGIVVAAIFIISHSRSAAREQTLRLYCDQHGLSFDKRSEPLLKQVHIAGSGWRMVSEMRASEHSSRTQGSHWHHETRWETTPPAKSRPVYMLGSVPESSDWERMPVWMRGIVLEKLGAMFGINLENYNVRELLKKGSTAFMLFEETDGSPLEDMSSIEAHLRDWPEKMPVVIRSGADGVSIKVIGFSLEDELKVDRLVRLGKAVAGL